MPRAVQQIEKPAGWGGTTLKEMLNESRRQFEETGSYCGVTHLTLKEADPLKYERLYSRLRGMMVASREAALRVSASPIVKELGELCFALYTPEGDSVVLSTGIIVHVHTMSMAIKWMIDNDYEADPCINRGDIFGNNDPLIGDAHTADVQSLTPIFYGDEVVGWVGAVTHVMDCGGVDAGGLPIMTINRFGDGLYLSCEKVGTDWKLRRDYEIRCDRNLRYPLFWHLDEKARLAGSQIVHDTIGGIIDEFGIDYYKSFIREVIEEGRQIFTKRVIERLFPGVFSSVSFYDVDQKNAPLPVNCREGQYHARAGQGRDQARRTIDLRYGRDQPVELPSGQLLDLGDAGRLLGLYYPDAGLRRQGERRGVPGYRPALPVRFVGKSRQPPRLKLRHVGPPHEHL